MQTKEEIKAELMQELNLHEKELIQKYGSKVYDEAKVLTDLVITLGVVHRREGEGEKAAKLISCVAELAKKADENLGVEARKAAGF